MSKRNAQAQDDWSVLFGTETTSRRKKTSAVASVRGVAGPSGPMMGPSGPMMGPSGPMMGGPSGPMMMGPSGPTMKAVKGTKAVKTAKVETPAAAPRRRPRLMDDETIRQLLE